MVSLFEFTLLLKIDNFRVIDTDWTSESFSSDDLVDQVHRLGWELNPLDCLHFRLIWVEEANRMWVLVIKSRGWDKFNCIISLAISIELCFGAHRDCTLLIETGPGHRALVLPGLKLGHGLVLLDSPKVILISNANSWVNPGLRCASTLSQIVNIGCSLRSLLKI